MKHYFSGTVSFFDTIKNEQRNVKMPPELLRTSTKKPTNSSLVIFPFCRERLIQFFALRSQFFYWPEP